MNIEFLKTNASLFKKAAERCQEKRPLANGMFGMLMVPGVVNYAFSIELYLKYLLVKNNQSSKGHELIKLFTMLDSSMRQEIINLTKYSNSDFDDLFSKHSNGFVEWRYIHEQEKEVVINIDFMRRLLDSIESIANRP
ncbi:MAG: HEPN domain-containing protein [Candidatus Wallbacteria bacterium]|nr:HEPN domain-containing protein [Candidatus Wallbacteria bacterium]